MGGKQHARGAGDAGGGATEPADAAAQPQRLLKLVETRDHAQQALEAFLPLAASAAAACSSSGASAASSSVEPVGLALLACAFASRQSAWRTAVAARASCTDDRAGKMPARTKETGKRDAMLAAKTAQSVIKLYASANAATAKPGSAEQADIVAAMDLACMALYVAWSLEHVTRFGDLVLDNMLYQVAKKYADMACARASASFVASCVHLRLWSSHAALSKKLKARDDCPTRSRFVTALLQPNASCEALAMDIKLLAEFPRPSSFHSAQFTRLLLGHTNTCVTLLVAAGEHEAVLSAAENTLSPWTAHLGSFPGQEPKLAASFNDRTFRVLWKCASAVDASGAIHQTLRFRGAALSFLLKCPNYTSLYFIQQVYRVGVQHERATKRSATGFQDLYEFYASSANALARNQPNSPCLYTSKDLQWDYLQWMEHFACICENSGRALEGVMVLENASHYVHPFGALEGPVRASILCLIVGTLLDAAGSSKPSMPHLRQHDGKNATFADRLESNVARVNLKKLEALVPSCFLAPGLQDHSAFVPFMIRCLKKSTVKMFSYTASKQQSAHTQLHSQVVSSFGGLCKALKELRSNLTGGDAKELESLILNESRLHRMAVALIVRFCCAGGADPAHPPLPAILRHVNLLRELLDDAMAEGNPRDAILQGVLSDLNSIARECYGCATQFYKRKNYQDTIAALMRTFELADSYLEYVMCSNLTAEEIQNAHAQLRVDAIASLLAHCFHETGEISSARKFTGYSILYGGDANEKIPQAAIDKYVSSLLEELRIRGADMLDPIASDFEVFVSNVTHVFKARHISEHQLAGTWSAFRTSLERVSARIMIGMRTLEREEMADAEVIEVTPDISMQLCTKLEGFLDELLMRSNMGNENCESSRTVLVDVCGALANRKLSYSAYYTTHDPAKVIEGLLQSFSTLSDAAERLKLQAGVGADLAGVYGWRGVITMEIALVSSYATVNDSMVAIVQDSSRKIDEESAIVDIEHCLMYGGQDDGCSPGVLFDAARMACCLEAVCNSLSLISCPVLEKAARSLLKTFQAAAEKHNTVLVVVLSPSLGLLDIQAEDDAQPMEVDSPCHAHSSCSVSEQFEQVDGEIAAAMTSHLNSSAAQACQHLLNAVKALKEIRSGGGRCSSAAMMAKATGMRELLVHLVLSEVHFCEGRGKNAVAEAKAALGICWKLSKKFVSPSSANETGHFELPAELTKLGTSEGQPGASSSLIYFKALECSSWDLLHATKLSLCRIASLYQYLGQPQRAATYLAEAMQLVGGLKLRFFQRSPFYEFAELQLNSSHLQSAKTAMGLLPSHLEQDIRMDDDHADDDTEFAHHSCFSSDAAFIEQKCNEAIQRGDVLLADADAQGALACYADAIRTLKTARSGERKLSRNLANTAVRCWRKITYLKSSIIDLTDAAAVEDLLAAMKKLKRSMKTCDARLERVKCMLELGRTNVCLLRSSSSRAFLNLESTIALLEEAFSLGDPLGIPHTSQALRAALGMAYFVEIEEDIHDDGDSVESGERHRFLSWASGSLLANSSFENLVNSVSSAEGSASAKEAVDVQLERLASEPSAASERSPREKMAETIGSIAAQVGELPDSWLVTSMTIGLSSELVITRIQTDGTAPISFCLPNVDWKSCVREVERIIQESRKTLSGHSVEEAGAWTAEQKKHWWTSRKGLDKRMEKAVESMQNALGFWRCLLLKGTATKYNDSVQRCWAVLTSGTEGPIKLAERNKALLCAIVDAQEWLSDEEVTEGMRHIAAEIEVALSGSRAKEVLQILREGAQDLKWPGRTASAAGQDSSANALCELTTEGIRKMKVGEVKQHLKSAGLSTDGLKTVLVERLLAARDAKLFQGLEHTPQWTLSTSTADSSCSTILILNHQLQEFPWEGMDVMRGCRGVTRMPSLALILQNAKRRSSPICARREHVRYVLNPAGDLKSTQQHLGPVLESGRDAFGWEGLVGQPPQPDELREYLLDADLYIYCGHGSGEKYLHRDKVLELQSRGCSAALLFGCSSGRLEKEGVFGPNGAVLSYLQAGSPSVLAMLWDVTDKDIDQLSVKVLREWLLEEDTTGRPLAQVLHDARRVCKLKYLNGHAAVCYGLPLLVVRS